MASVGNSRSLRAPGTGITCLSAGNARVVTAVSNVSLNRAGIHQPIEAALVRGDTRCRTDRPDRAEPSHPLPGFSTPPCLAPPMGSERDMGRRLEPVPVRTGGTAEDRTGCAAFFVVMSLPVLAFVDWAVARAVIRAVQCEHYARGGVLDCGGSSAMEEALTMATLPAVPMLAAQIWLIGFAIRRIRNGPGPLARRSRSHHGSRRRDKPSAG